MRKIRLCSRLLAVLLLLASCASCAPKTSPEKSWDHNLASLCGLSLEEATALLGCTEADLRIDAENDAFISYYLPDQTPPWEVGEDGTSEITITVFKEDKYVAGAWCLVTDMTHSIADEEAARALYSLLQEEDDRLTEAFGPTGFMAFTNGEFERLDDQPTFFETYPDADSFVSRWEENPESLSSRGEWLSEGDTPVWLQFDWNAGQKGSIFTWNYQTERFTAYQLGWEDLEYAD